MKNDKISEKDHRRHVRFFNLFRPICALYMKLKFNYRHDDLSKIKGPYLFLSNHNTDFDPIMIGVATANQLYFVSSEHVTHKGFLSKLLMFFLHPLIHLKGKAGIATIGQMLKCLKAGYNVAIFPEGNRSFNGLTCYFEPTIGRVAKKSGASLVTFRFEGGYLSQPRWSFKSRKGRIYGHLVRVYSPEELSNMTDDEINTCIYNDLQEDAYAGNTERIAYKGRNKAYGLETTLFTCPKCHAISTLHSKGDRITCGCGFIALYNDYGELEFDDTVRTVSELDKEQHRLLDENISASIGSSSALFSDEVIVRGYNSSHELVSTSEGLLKGFADHAEYNGRPVLLGELTGLAVYARNTLVVHTQAEGLHYEIKGRETMFSALKYLYLYNYHQV